MLKLTSSVPSSTVSGKLAVFLILMIGAALNVNAAEVVEMTVGEGFEQPLGFHDPTPTFSWKLPRGVTRQTAYRLQVESDRREWDSGWVESDRSVLVPCDAGPFESRELVRWRVNYRDEDGREGGWSEWAHLEMGLLTHAEWEASWIRPATGHDRRIEDVAWLRRGFKVAKPVARARLYITARGLFQVEINGKRVGEDYFANGWTPYLSRIDTVTYDVTEHLRQGSNTIQSLLGTGWFAGKLSWERAKFVYGDDPELLLQLEIRYEDGAEQRVLSDGSWEGTYDGPILSASIYDGCIVDARLKPDNWGPVSVNADIGSPASRSIIKQSSWPRRFGARVEPASVQLTPKPFQPAKAIKVLEAEKIVERGSGTYIFDFGQNMAGIPRIKVPMEPGQTVRMNFGELLEKDGSLFRRSYGSAKSEDSYTAAGSKVVEWEAVFTFHGFRYVQLSGLGRNLEPEKSWCKAVVLHTGFERIGEFSCSNPVVNQLQNNIVWSQRSNFLDIPTDCPQRDERMGWTGDAQVFSATSLFNFNCHAFWKSWLDSMRDDQKPDGRTTMVVPAVKNRSACPGWLDAATIVPWNVYVRTGDREVLSENYDMMARVVAWYREEAGDDWFTEVGGYGDWVQPYRHNRRHGDTSPILIGNAFWARDTQILARSAKILGREQEAKQYRAELDKITQAFTATYLTPEGTIRMDPDEGGRRHVEPETQTACLLALSFDLVPAEARETVFAQLVRLIDEADGHLRTGIQGTPFLIPVLDDNDRQDLAVDLLLKDTYPSWLYSVKQGATTIWESWNGYTHEKGFLEDRMISFNHYAYGAIGQWMYERLAGLRPDPEHPGYKHFFIHPLLAERLDEARAELETPYGRAISAWKREGHKVVLQVVVPPNATATLQLSGRAPETLKSGEYEFCIGQ